MAQKRIKREFEDLKKEPSIAKSANPFGDDIFHWTVKLLGPEKSPYAEGIFDLDIRFPPDYPFKPPVVIFSTKIYHCNVDSNGGICLALLKDQWSPATSISQAIRLLICQRKR